MAKRKGTDEETGGTVAGDPQRVDPETGGSEGVSRPGVADAGPAGEPASPAPDLSLERSEPSADLPAVRKRKPRSDKGQRRGGAGAPESVTPEADRALLASAFGGTFEALALALGDHWRLNPAREVDGTRYPAEAEALAVAWQPVFDRYGGKMTGEAFMWIGASTATIAVVAPRIRVSVQHETGVIGWIKRKLAGRRVH